MDDCNLQHDLPYRSYLYDLMTGHQTSGHQTFRRKLMKKNYETFFSRTYLLDIFPPSVSSVILKASVKSVEE